MCGRCLHICSSKCIGGNAIVFVLCSVFSRFRVGICTFSRAITVVFEWDAQRSGTAGAQVTGAHICESLRYWFPEIASQYAIISPRPASSRTHVSCKFLSIHSTPSTIAIADIAANMIHDIITSKPGIRMHNRKCGIDPRLIASYTADDMPHTGD